jgi:hypothetical protein
LDPGSGSSCGLGSRIMIQLQSWIQDQDPAAVLDPGS